MNSESSSCSNNHPERYYETIFFANIKDVRLECSILTFEVNDCTLSYDIAQGPLQLRGKREGEFPILEIEENAPPMEGEQRFHYVPVDPNYRFAGMLIDRFRPCGSEGQNMAFGLFFIGIGISDIDDITDGPASLKCSQTQQVFDVFKLLEGKDENEVPCSLELFMSDAFPGAMQVRFLNPEEGETARSYLASRPVF